MRKTNLTLISCIVFIYCFVILSNASAQNPLFNQPVDLLIEDEPLQLALLHLSRVCAIPIGFSDAIFDKNAATIRFQARGEPLHRVLDQLLANTGLEWKFTKGQIIIVRQMPREYILSGYVEDFESGERLVAAQISIPALRRRVFTNDYGFFSLQVPADKSFLLVASMLGYGSVTRSFEKVPSNQHLTFFLQPSAMLQEVVISSDSAQAVPGKFIPIDRNFAHLPLDKMPSLGGEADLLRAIAITEPGINSGTDGFSGLAVRGGDSDHNMILLDDAPVFQPTHGLGLFSVINPDIVRSAQLWKGDAPARIGPRIGSVLDVRTREGNLYKPSAKASISWVAARLTFECPIKKEKSALLFSVRRSLIGPFIRNFSSHNKAEDDKSGASTYHFADLNLKLNWIISPKDRLYLSSYCGTDVYRDRDSFSYQSPLLPFLLYAKVHTDYRWNNLSAALRWNHLHSERTFINTTLTASSFYLYSTSENQSNLRGIPVDLANVSQSEVQFFSLQTDLDFFISHGNILKAGFALADRVVHPFHYEGLFDTLTIRQNIIAPNRSFTASVFGSYEWQSQDQQMMIRLGLRGDWFLDRQHFLHYAIQPRFSLEKLLRNNVLWKFSINRSVQSVRSVSPNGLETIRDFWLLSNRNIPLQSAWQFTTGPAWSSNTWNAGTNFFFKFMEGLDEYAPVDPDSAVAANSSWEDRLVFGNGQSMGVECFARLIKGPFRIWAAYTLSGSYRRFETLNEGKKFPARLGRVHDFSLAFVWKTGKNWSVSANWQLGSGDFVSKLLFQEGIGKMRFLDLQTSVDQAERLGYGNFRQPWQHRLDLSVTREWTHRRLTHLISIGLYNAYNYQNRYFTFWQLPGAPNPTLATLNKVNGLPILPSITWTLQY